MYVPEENGNRKMVSAFLKAAYTNLSCESKVGAGRSKPFGVSSRLRQEAYYLFCCFRCNKLNGGLVEGGWSQLRCGSMLISTLLYADDAVIFADDEKSIK